MIVGPEIATLTCEMKASNQPFLAAVVQAAPVFMDREASLDKACEQVLDAAQHGARLVAFPASFIPCYPEWVWTVPASEEQMLSELYAEFIANAVTIPSDSLDKLCRIARRAKTHVVIGVSERNVEASGASLYNTLVYIGAQGQILGKHRQLVPSGGERLVWAQGDGSTLQVHDTPWGKIGGLVGAENYMPLARYSLYAWGVQIYVAAQSERDATWLPTLRHIAKEGRVYVLCPSSIMRPTDIPERYAFKLRFDPEMNAPIYNGNSAIVNPDGELIARSESTKEEILYAEIDPQHLHGLGWKLDVAGHFARPDVFRFWVNRQPRQVVTKDDGARDLEEFDRAETL